jgi:cytochrome c
MTPRRLAFALSLVAALLLVATGAAQSSAAAAMPAELTAQDGSAERGQALFAQQCAICHTMNGSASSGMVGPDLLDFASRPLIADAVPNTAENLVRFIVNPPAVKPGTFMPQLGLTTAQAADLAALLLPQSEAGAGDAGDVPLE